MMEYRLRRRKQFRQRSNLQVIKTWLTSLVMTVGVVFFVVTVIPDSPKATIHEVNTMERAIAYEVTVTDADEAVTAGSLLIVLSNQFERHVQSLQLGFNAGLFEGLEPGTDYEMSVIGNKGFGDVRLAKTAVRTDSLQGGLIVMRSDLITKNEYDYTYVFDVFIGALEGLITDYVVSYGMIYHMSGDEEPYVYYEHVMMSTQYQQIIWEGIYGYGYEAHIKLERIVDTNTGAKVLLDEIYFYAPFEISASFYIEYALGHMILGALYPMFTRVEDAVYTVSLQMDGKVIQAYTYTKDDLGPLEYMIEFVFDRLDPDQTYVIEFSAAYTNPDTLINEHVVIETIEFPPGRASDHVE